MPRGQLEEPLLQNGHGNNEKERKVEVSKNVYIIYGLLFWWALAESIWSGAVLAAWLFLLAGGNTDANPNEDEELGFLFAAANQSSNANTVVGGIEALQGLATLFTAIPIGYLADKYGKARVCKLAGVSTLAFSAMALMAVLSEWDAKTQLQILGASMVIYGTANGIISGPIQALFADSVPQGQRSHFYTILQVCYMAPGIVGPLIAIFLFQKFGNNWTYEELRRPFAVGVCMQFPSALLAFFLSDDYAVDEPEQNQTSGKDQAVHASRRSYTLPIVGVRLDQKSIPLVLFFSDLFYSMGSGMTIKFFPLFFMKDVGLSPSAVQGIRVTVTFTLIAFSILAQRLSKKLGRVQTVIGSRTSGILLLVTLSLLVSNGVTSPMLIIPVYLIRTSFMNCCYPIDESILMDNVKKNERSRWKSLQSVSSLGWCGSALFGGYLADAYGYEFSFLITACLQFSGCLTYSMLLPLVEDEGPIAKTAAQEANVAMMAAANDEDANEVGSPKVTFCEINEDILRENQQSP